MRTYRTSSVKSLYACSFLSPVEVSADEQNKQSIWSFLQATCSSLRLASGDLYEQFLIEKESIGKAEVKVFIHRNSRYIALLYPEALTLSTMTRKFPSPSWPTNDGDKLRKIRWWNLCLLKIP